MKVTNDIRYVGVNDHEIDLFEGQYDVPNGMAYNSYVIMDEKIAVMDTVDVNFAKEWLLHLAHSHTISLSSTSRGKPCLVTSRMSMEPRMMQSSMLSTHTKQGCRSSGQALTTPHPETSSAPKPFSATMQHDGSGRTYA